MVGIGTVLADDPRLTARHVPVKRWARRVVVDPQGRIPRSARLLAGQHGAGRQAAPVTLAVHQEVLAARPKRLVELEAMGVELIGLAPVGAGKDSPLALAALLRHLSERHAATNVLVEGGSKLLGSLFDQGLVDQVLVFVAPILLGDAQAVPAVQGLISDRITSTRGLILSSQRRFGDDLLLDYRVRSRPS
jgi:diaminohydroxyphosphoribosylaminopyrimidine deaminase/5-amino-6-(5-phosphoribosylamino)uracil reductase